jgi:hypothetical protein
MPCLIALLMLAFPRVAVALLFLFSNFFEHAHLDIIVILLGFLFLPLTLIVYAWTVGTGHTVNGIYLVAIIIAVLADIGFLGGGEYHRRGRA